MGQDLEAPRISTNLRSTFEAGAAVLTSCDHDVAKWNMPRTTVDRLAARRTAKVSPTNCLTSKCYCQEYERGGHSRRGCLFAPCHENQDCCDRSEEERSYFDQQRAKAPAPKKQELRRRRELHGFGCRLTPQISDTLMP